MTTRKSTQVKNCTVLRPVHNNLFRMRCVALAPSAMSICQLSDHDINFMPTFMTRAVFRIDSALELCHGDINAAIVVNCIQEARKLLQLRGPTPVKNYDDPPHHVWALSESGKLLWKIERKLSYSNISHLWRVQCVGYEYHTFEPQRSFTSMWC